jgi:hypothetical protein
MEVQAESNAYYYVSPTSVLTPEERCGGVKKIGISRRKPRWVVYYWSVSPSPPSEVFWCLPLAYKFLV